MASEATTVSGRRSPVAAQRSSSTSSGANYRSRLVSTSGMVNTSSVVNISGMVSNFQHGGQRLPARRSTNTSVLTACPAALGLALRAAEFEPCDDYNVEQLAALTTILTRTYPRDIGSRRRICAPTRLVAAMADGEPSGRSTWGTVWPGCGSGHARAS